MDVPDISDAVQLQFGNSGRPNCKVSNLNNWPTMTDFALGAPAQEMPLDRAGFRHGIDHVSLSSEYGRNVAQAQINPRSAHLPVPRRK